MKDQKIAVALHRGAFIQALDIRGHLLFSIAAETLIGYTSTTVSVQQGAFVQTYGIRGQLISTVSAL